MSRKKAEFKNLGTLPKGEWQLTQHRDGSIICACQDYPPKVIADGKMKDLNPVRDEAEKPKESKNAKVD